MIDGLLDVLRRHGRPEGRHRLRPDRVPVRSRVPRLRGREGGRLPLAGAGRGARQGVRRPEGLEGAAGVPGLPRSTRASRPRQGIPGLLAGSANPVGPPYTATEMDVDKRAEAAAADPQALLTSTSSWTNLNTFSSRGGKLALLPRRQRPVVLGPRHGRLLRADDAGERRRVHRHRLEPALPGAGDGPLRRRPGDARHVRHAGRGRRLGREPEGPARRSAPRARSWPGRSRPLCPYPKHAHYKGTGDVEDAASFECR